MALTDPSLKEAKWKGIDRWLSDGGSRGAGRLVAKVSSRLVPGEKKAGTAVHFYFAYFDGDANRRFFPLGRYSSGGTNGGLTLKTARDEAAKHSRLYRDGVINLHDHYRRECADKEARDKAKEAAARRAEQLAKAGSLRLLLEGYTAHLERSGKQSFRDVRSSFERNVFKPFPELCERRASEVTPTELRDVIARVVQAGKGREAAKLRAFLRAAYSLAIKAVSDPTAPPELYAMGIEANPAAGLAPMSQFNKACERTLSADELRHYWLRVVGLPESAQRDALMLALLLGGQRPTQLLRARAPDVDMSGRTVTLRDDKGARKQPRLHVLPLTDCTADIFARLAAANELEANKDAPTLFTTDGKRGTNISTISHIVTNISEAMLEAKESREPFTLRDIRRTCETMLAALGVQRDTRAQLLSHGLSGVQSVHYDRHQYEAEKRGALEAWERRLNEIANGKKRQNVIPMRARNESA